MAGGGKTTKILVWILMAMLILGLGGFGITNLGGSLRTVGEVGSKPITVDSYSRALQQTLRSQQAADGRPMSFAEAQSRQLDRITLSQLAAARALDHETSELGLSVGDEVLAQRIVETRAFAGLDGKFDRAIYTDQLDRQRFSESEYEALLREETARNILEQAVFNDVPVSETYTNTIVSFIGERRSFTYAMLDESHLDAPLPALDEAALKAFHTENSALYMRPAIKKISYVLLTPEMLINDIEVDETALRALYDERIAQYDRKERRLVERLVFANEADATAAIAALDAGEKSFEALVEERGLNLSDIDLGDLTESELGEAGSGIFAAQSGEVAGPFPTDLGPALFRINGILPAQSASFEEASDELRQELAQDRVRRVLDGRIEAIEDLLAGGATLEDIDAETQMELATIDWHVESIEGPTGYQAFRTAAAQVTTDDFPELISLEDGGLVALRLDGEEGAALRPYDSVKAEVARDAAQAQLADALIAKAQALSADITSGASFAELGLTPQTEEALTRSDHVSKAPPTLISEVFALKTAGEVTVISSGSEVALVRLDAILPPDPSDADLAQSRLLLEQQLQSDIGQDLFQMFVTDIQSRVPTYFDQSAINAVNAQFQ